ncbi:MAG: hypothetical protein MI919_13845, partial [Holophagales bacterium]|nr:hypothetical protein [Holophagales bacterium]
PTVFAQDGVTVLGTVDLASGASRGGYPVLRLTPQDRAGSSRLFAEVRQQGSPESGATYRLSAGTPIASDAPADAGTCVQSSRRLCLAGNRFAVEVPWGDAQGNVQLATAVPLTADTGTFWFFTPDNVEVAIKVLDARDINDRFWVFFGALSNVVYTVRVTDTVTGAEKLYDNPTGRFASVADTDAFDPNGAGGIRIEEVVPGSPPTISRATAPPPACVTDATGLCLTGDRFRVEATWRPSTIADPATAQPLTGDSGYFFFFGEDNVELVVKVLDARAINGSFWVFYAALSEQEFELKVTDTQTGAQVRYLNPDGNLASVGDVDAFPVP